MIDVDKLPCPTQTPARRAWLHYMGVFLQTLFGEFWSEYHIRSSVAPVNELISTGVEMAYYLIFVLFIHLVLFQTFFSSKHGRLNNLESFPMNTPHPRRCPMTQLRVTYTTKLNHERVWSLFKSTVFKR